MRLICATTNRARSIGFGVLILCCAGGGQALYADEAQPQTPVSATPESTTETFGDWTLVCNTLPNIPSKVCEVDATITIKGQNAPIVRVAFARPAKDKPIRIVVQAPNNILIAPGAKIEVEAGKGAVALVYRSCTPAGCFAESDISADQLKTFRGRTAPGQIVMTDPAGKSFALPLSYRGVDQALDALAKR
jgi:invasion protein IalB